MHPFWSSHSRCWSSMGARWRGEGGGRRRGVGGAAWGEGGVQEGPHAGSTLLLIWFGQGCCAAAHAAVAACVSHPVFKAKTRCSSYVCPRSSCHTYGQNVSTENQCL
jgi:hypothetical protein